MYYHFFCSVRIRGEQEVLSAGLRNATSNKEIAKEHKPGQPTGANNKSNAQMPPMKGAMSLRNLHSKVTEMTAVEAKFFCC
jgi:hypothetical protein